MAILFISNLVPDEERYRTSAFTRSGNNVLSGIANALAQEKNVTLLSCMPVPAFPAGKIFLKPKNYRLANGLTIHFLPILNLKLLKQIVWGILCFFYIIGWSRKHRDESRHVLLYNTYTPPVGHVYRACRLTKSKLSAILYDLGMPSKKLGLSRLTMLGYRAGENAARKYIPKIDGRIIINENIARYYAPGKDYILVDGGISEQVRRHLFPLSATADRNLVLVCAGLLWEQNGTRLLLEVFHKYPDLKAEIFFAGNGKDVKLIEDAARKDSRIHYAGMLSMDDLFRLYERADVLLNLRKEDEIDFHFPSKLLEYIVTGRHVISTPVAHAERDYGKYITILNEYSPDALATAIGQLCNSNRDELLALGQQARAFMLRERSWEHQTKRIIKYIETR